MIQINTHDLNLNCFTPIPDRSSWKNEPVALEAESVQLVEAFQGVAAPFSGPESGEPKPASKLMRSALDAIPTDLSVDTWTKLVAAVKDGAPDVQTAESLLKEWSNENLEGEYARELDESSENTVSTLFGIAKQHGWERPKNPADEGGSQSGSELLGDDFTLTDFEAILDGLDDDATSTDVERQALQLVDDVSSLPDEEIMEAKLLLRDAGARAREMRDWYTLVKERKKKRQQEESEAQQQDRGGPSGLKAGEITAWIAERILETDHFALDRGKALYYFENGRYRGGGEEYLDRRVMDILDEEDITAEFSKYRCKEVLHRITTGASTLWETPPGDRICLKNGIYNLRTGELEPHSPEWLSTRQIPISYNSDAQGTAWQDFLESVMPEDGGATLGLEFVAQFFQPASNRRRASYLIGGPNTGKSTLIDNLQEGVVGRSNTTNFALQDLAGKNQRACLYGKTMNVCADLPAEPMKGVSVFKQITGGDRISAEHKYKDPFNFTPHCHLLFSGNGPIMAPGAGEAFWDRWIVIPFENNFSKGTAEHIPKHELDARLRNPEELSALLNEVLPIVREDRGVTATPSMEAALERMRRAGEEQETNEGSKIEFPSPGGDGAQEEEEEPEIG